MSDASSTSGISESASTPPSSVPSPTLSSLNLRDVSEEEKKAAVELKTSANVAFQSHDFEGAIDLYSQAIEKNPGDATIYCNRAYARMKLEEHGYAIDDASKAIALDPKYVKAYYRRALCQLSVLRPQLAVPDLKKALVLDPQNKLAKAQLDATNKLIRRIQFEQAIDVGEEKSAIERCREIIEEGGCELEKDYSGPQLESLPSKKYGITAAFVEAMIEWFKSGKNLPRRYAWEIILGCHAELVKEESLVDAVLEDGVTCDVIGDTHGQFYDLVHLMDLTGRPSETHCLLFNGDFVDRGSWSVEVALTLFAYKWLYPKRVLLNRGNHETKDMNKMYGFEGEVRHKHGEMTYKLFSDAFTALPLATLISPALPPLKASDKVSVGGITILPSIPPSLSSSEAILSPEGRKRYFVVHGGLFSKDGVTLEDIRKIQRIGKQPGNEGLMCELLWTDPQVLPGRGPSKRGVGIGFGPDVTRRWCELNGVTSVMRSHEVRQGGYAVEHDGLCITVFSAPNYCDQVGNKGAYVRVDCRGELQFETFLARPHPPMKPMAYASPALGMGSMFS